MNARGFGPADIDRKTAARRNQNDGQNENYDFDDNQRFIVIAEIKNERMVADQIKSKKIPNAVGGQDRDVSRKDHLGGLVAPNDKTVGDDDREENDDKEIPAQIDLHFPFLFFVELSISPKVLFWQTNLAVL